MTKLTHEQLLADLTALFDCQAFELYKEVNTDGSLCFLIPYMMNDALECYLLLKNSSMTGEFLPECKETLEAEFISDKQRTALIIHQGMENVFTIFFESVWKVTNCYQYHSIGHFWVEGQEQWRQLVYMIGTICDKYDYLGESVCNQQELSLMPLMGFAPFRMWSPIHESLDDRYPETVEGAELMYSLSMGSGLKWFAFLVRLYRFFPLRFLANLLGKKLTKTGMEPLYELIYERVVSASTPYPIRDYGDAMNDKIHVERENATRILYQKGFSGTYPLFCREGIQLVAAEEHPFTFTFMDYKDFHFRIQFMVSECTDRANALNAGFFRKRGRKGWIAKTLDEIKR